MYRQVTVNLVFFIVAILHFVILDYTYSPIVPKCDVTILIAKIIFPIASFAAFTYFAKRNNLFLLNYFFLFLFILKPVIINLTNMNSSGVMFAMNIFEFYYLSIDTLFSTITNNLCTRSLYLFLSTFIGWLICFATIFLLSLKIIVKHNLFERLKKLVDSTENKL